MAVFGGFFVGPYVALRVSMGLTPDSDLVQTASVLAFALVFVGGTLVWAGVGIAAVVARAFGSVLRGRLPGADPRVRADDTIVPPGYARTSYWASWPALRSDRRRPWLPS